MIKKDYKTIAILLVRHIEDVLDRFETDNSKFNRDTFVSFLIRCLKTEGKK